MHSNRLRSVGIAVILAASLNGQAPSSRNLTKADIEKMMTELSNWGRWGKDDQLGTINLITPAKRRAAAALVKEGFSVSLARTTDTQKAVDNPAPVIYKMSPPAGEQFHMDEISIFYHGFAHTHIDALSHVFNAGKMYNGFPASSVTGAGSGTLAITALKNGLFSRGVLVDLPQLKNVPYLDDTAAIYPEDLDAWEKKTGVRVESGDIVFVRTGRWARRAERGPWDTSVRLPGLHASCARWLKQRNVAALGGDTSSDVQPSGIAGVDYPVHQLLMVAMGMPMMDQCDLEALSKAAAARKRWTFLITAAPIAIAGGTGSPLNPIATF